MYPGTQILNHIGSIFLFLINFLIKLVLNNFDLYLYFMLKWIIFI